MNPVESDAYRYAVKNAFEHAGKANSGAVIGKLKALHSDQDIKTLAQIASAQVQFVNALAAEKLKSEFERFDAEGWELKARQKEEGSLPDLDCAANEKVVTRFAPNPSSVMHLGHVRAALLSAEYAKKYNGSFILRFEDTDPKTKKPIAGVEEQYALDLEWLGTKPIEVFYQSDRFERYYEVLRELMNLDAAYVCTCDNDAWKKDKAKGIACACRDKKADANQADFAKMLSHDFKEGQAVVRIKTDMLHPDPSVRDWWAAKIVDKPVHPRRANTWVWPGYNLAAGVDDHDMGITLILRGQEHAQNAQKQEFMYNHLGWKYPHAIHFGRMATQGFLLSKSKINELLANGEIRSFDDPRLGTLQALRRRGFSANAIKKMVLELGVNTNDATLSLEKLFHFNQKEIESKITRLDFFESIAEITPVGVPPNLPSTVIVSGATIKEMEREPVIRLRHLYNVGPLPNNQSQYLGTEKVDAPIRAWALARNAIKKISIVMDDNSTREGCADAKINQTPIGDFVSFDSLGICRVEAHFSDSTKLIFTQP